MSSAPEPPIEQTQTVVPVRGAVPHELSGLLLAVTADGLVRRLRLHAGRATACSFDTRSPGAIRDVVALGTSALAIDDAGRVHELRVRAGGAPRVDLAGGGRCVIAGPVRDRETGQLHLLAQSVDDDLRHVVITAGAMSRRTVAAVDAPRRVHGLVVVADRVVYFGDRLVGESSGAVDARTRWMETDLSWARPIDGQVTRDAVAVFVRTPALERWTFSGAAEQPRREVIDPRPQRVVLVEPSPADATRRHLWALGERSITRHELVRATHVRLDLGRCTPFAGASLATGSTDAAAPQLIAAVVHDDAAGSDELWLIGADERTVRPLAQIRMPSAERRIRHLVWLPAGER